VPIPSERSRGVPCAGQGELQDQRRVEIVWGEGFFIYCKSLLQSPGGIDVPLPSR